MSTLRVLSVNEDGGRSDRMSAEQRNWVHGESETLNISIDVDRTLTITTKEYACFAKTIQFKGIDLSGLIEYLQDVQTFISEEDMIYKLKG